MRTKTTRTANEMMGDVILTHIFDVLLEDDVIPHEDKYKLLLGMQYANCSESVQKFLSKEKDVESDPLLVTLVLRGVSVKACSHIFDILSYCCGNQEEQINPKQHQNNLMAALISDYLTDENTDRYEECFKAVMSNDPKDIEECNKEGGIKIAEHALILMKLMAHLRSDE